MKRIALALLLAGAPAVAQVDQARAAAWFQEADALCRRDGGKLWGISLCGPMVIADAATHTIATNRAAPDAKQPPMLGFANSAIDWGGTRWTTLVWQMIPAEEHARGRLMVHELFHRVQPDLGFVIRDGNNEHLDTLEGRYWMQLEWRALAKAVAASGEARILAMRDALAFRTARRNLFAGSAENERLLEMNEGLAQYTGTVVAFPTASSAAADTVDQLATAEKSATFVRTFAYPSGAAYGILLDAYSPGWNRRLRGSDDFGDLLIAAAKITPAQDSEAAAKRYGGAALRTAELARDREQKARIAELRRRFVEGPVLVLPPSRTNTFSTAGITPIPGEGTIYPTFRTTADWGSLEASTVLIAADRSHLTVPAPANVEGATIHGEGWTLTIAPGWRIVPGARKGDYQLTK